MRGSRGCKLRHRPQYRGEQAALARRECHRQREAVEEDKLGVNGGHGIWATTDCLRDVGARIMGHTPLPEIPFTAGFILFIAQEKPNKICLRKTDGYTDMCRPIVLPSEVRALLWALLAAMSVKDELL